MNCPNCKNPINDNSDVCEWCGFSLNAKQEDKNVSISNKDKPSKWHGLITFWLVMMIISGSITAVFYLLPSSVLSSIGMTFQNTRYVIANLCVANVLASILLLHRAKLGIYILLLCAIISLILNIIAGVGVISVLMGIISIVILFALFQLSKNGIKAWHTLQGFRSKKITNVHIIFIIVLLSFVLTSVIQYSIEKKQNDLSNLHTVTGGNGTYSIDIPALLTPSYAMGVDLYYVDSINSVEVCIIKERKEEVKSILSFTDLSSYANYIHENLVTMKFAAGVGVRIGNLPAIYYEVNDNTYCGGKAFIETDIFFYQIIVVAPLEKKTALPIQQIVYSFKITD
jgi:hypothetical protein